MVTIRAEGFKQCDGDWDGGDDCHDDDGGGDGDSRCPKLS